MNTFNNRSLSPYDLISAYHNWLMKLEGEEYEICLLTTMFKPLRGTQTGIAKQMEKELELIYSRMITRIIRKPRSTPLREFPILVGVPDFPTYKKARYHLSEAVINGGRHYHCFVAAPPRSRLKSGLVGHFRSEYGLYVNDDTALLSLDCQKIESGLGSVTDYVFKSAKRGRVTEADLVILPKSHSELPMR